LIVAVGYEGFAVIHGRFTTAAVLDEKKYSVSVVRCRKITDEMSNDSAASKESLRKVTNFRVKRYPESEESQGRITGDTLCIPS
jgi:hypothetical protein